MTRADDVAVTELTPGEYLVELAGRRHQVVLPAGVGIPGYADEDVVAATVVVLVQRGSGLPPTLDLSAVLAADPGILAVVEDELERDE